MDFKNQKNRGLNQMVFLMHPVHKIYIHLNIPFRRVQNQPNIHNYNMKTHVYLTKCFNFSSGLLMRI